MKIIIFSFFVSLSAWAYIPTTNFVFNRVADLHGTGSYRINMDVVFKEGAETQTVKESWIVHDSGDMFVIASGNEFKLAKLTKRGRTYWVEQVAGDRTSESSIDAFMPILFQRNATSLKQLFVRWGVLPPDVLKEKKVPKELLEIKNDPEPFVRLGRVNGAVAYAYGEPDKPGVWVEQDHFFISKMRMPSGAEFLGQDYMIYAKNLAFPKNQVVSFGSTRVEIKVNSLSSAELTKEEKSRLEPSGLKNKPELLTTWPKSALTNSIQEFYKRFR